jgi:O-antigen ligase
MLAIPLLAVPAVVVSFSSFLGSYKLLVIEAGFLLALPRLVGRERGGALLWAYPISGWIIAVQLAWKTRGLGALRSSRLEMRTFYSTLGWGESNYIAAMLVLCALGSVVLAQLQRRALPRMLLLGSAVVMVVASVRLYSRGASAALGLAVLVFVLGLGRLRSLALLLLAGVAGLGLLASPYGRVLVSRFLDPLEYASWAERVKIWQAMWVRFSAHPWTGIGLNQGRYQADPAGIIQAHNVFLQYLSDQGIFGGLFILVAVVVLFALVPRLQSPDGVATRELRLASLALLVAALANGMVEPTLTGYSYGILLMYFIAWMTTAARPAPLVRAQRDPARMSAPASPR